MTRTSVEPIRLNLGSGNKYLHGYRNVDLYAKQADIRADLRKFRAEPNSVEHILCIHTIEHIDRESGTELIGRCFEWLKPNGFLEVETPCADKCRRLLSKGHLLDGAKGLLGGRSIDKANWHEWMIGWAKAGCPEPPDIPEKWDLPGEAHLTHWSTDELLAAFRSAGFKAKADEPVHHGNRVRRDTRVVGRKP